MANSTVTPSKPKRRWLRALVWLFLILVAILVVAYFVGTSSAFFKGVILPRVSQAINASVTVSDASISPFKQVVLKDLKVQAAGQEPLLTAPEVRLDYSLMDIMGGRINVGLVSISSPTVALVENPDGTSNLDPLLKAQQKPGGQPAQPPEAKTAKESKPMQLDLRKFSLTDATVRRVKLYAGGKRDLAELAHLNVSVENLKNGQTGKLVVSGDINMQNNPPAAGQAGALLASLDSQFSLALTPELKPASIQGNTRLGVKQATGSLSEVAGLGANLDCEVTPTEIKQVALRFQKNSARLGEILVSGPFNLEKTEGRLTVRIQNIDKQVLNLAGAASGLDFGPTTINSTNEVQLANAAASITAAGQFNLNQFQVTRTNQTTPPLDLKADYNVLVDRTAGAATVRALTLTGTQQGKPLLRGGLSNPLTISWGTGSVGAGDASLNVALTHLDLANWKAFLADVAPAGDVNARLQLLSKQAGKLLSFELTSDIQGLTAGSGRNLISQASVTLTAKGEAADLKQFKVPEYKLQVARQGQTLVNVGGSANYDLKAETADLNLTAQLVLARLLQAFPQPNLEASSGTVDLKAQVAQKGTSRNILANFALADFSARMGSNVFRGFGATADADLGMSTEQVQIRKLAGKLTEGQNAGGAFEVSGTYGLSNQAAQITAKLTDLNQNALRPFLQAALGDKKLVSISINGNASVQTAPKGETALKADVQMANLVVNDPQKQIPATPLEAKMLVDTSLTQSNKVVDIRQCGLMLTPADRAKNEVQLQGHIDMTDTNAIQGNLKLAAESLDVTRYYDVFVSDKTAAAKPAASTPRGTTGTPAGAPPGAPTGPQTNKLPFRNFTADANIGRFYLRELEITNLVASARLDGSKILLKPLQLALNGAPVSSSIDLDLGVPGYQYAVNFRALRVPFAPLVNTFAPERKGQLGGTITGVADLAGIGTSGASLRTNLAASFDIGSTNLNLSVANLKSPLMKTIVNVIAVVPTLIKNPGAALGTLAGSLLGGSSGQTGGWVDELQKSPIDVIQAKGAIAKGSGQLNLENALVQSGTFQAGAHGTVLLNDELTNSTLNIPLTVYLKRSLAEGINMVPAGTPTNATYVKLPDYVTITGTVGAPDKKLNTAALVGTALQQLGGNIPGLDKKTGNLLQGLGGLLTTPNATATNAPATTTNRPAGGGLLQGLGGLLNSPPRATSPSGTPPTAATNAPATNPNPVGNLLNQFLNPKK